jgi:hypothetical protein
VTPPAEVTDVIGFLAAAMTVIAFCCTRMLWLRSAAILANILFIAYGALLGLLPVLGLHCALLPLNILRFAQCWWDRAGRRCAAGDTADGRTTPLASSASIMSNPQRRPT